MIETLYKSKIPKLTAWQEEWFELTLGKQTVDGNPGFFVRETQCRWDSTAQRMVRVQYTLSPREGFATVEEAQRRYDTQRMSRARRGFIHSFSPCYEPTKKNKYTLIEIGRDAETHEKMVESPEPRP